jgi:RNA polymerase sigma factor (sigma-70 family)
MSRSARGLWLGDGRAEPTAGLRHDADTLFVDDPSLLAGFRGGCPQALARLYRYYAPAMSLYLRSLAYRSAAPELGQDSALADLVQEVFVRAFAPAARARYTPAAGLRAYLYTVARHCLVDLLRKRRHEILMENAGALNDVAGRAVDPWHDSGTARRAGIVSSYLAVLPVPLKQLYELRFVLGLSQEQASRALCLSRRRVRTLEGHLYRGLRRVLHHSEL